jgi:hypothetical protein
LNIDCNKIGTGGSPCRLSAVYPFILICHTSPISFWTEFNRFCAEVNNYCCWIFYFIWCICKNDILVTVTILERMKTVMILKVRFVYTSLDTKNVYISWANIYEYGYSVQRFRIWTRTPSSSDVWQIKIKGYTAESRQGLPPVPILLQSCLSRLIFGVVVIPVCKQEATRCHKGYFMFLDVELNSARIPKFSMHNFCYSSNNITLYDLKKKKNCDRIITLTNFR